MAELFDFKCTNSKCRHEEKLDHSDLKLQTTKVTSSGKQKAFQWTIFTCPKCKWTQVAAPGTAVNGKGATVFISPPNYERKAG